MRCRLHTKLVACRHLMCISFTSQRYTHNSLMFYHLFTHDKCHLASRMTNQQIFDARRLSIEQSRDIVLKRFDDISLEFRNERTVYVKMSFCRNDHEERFADMYGNAHTKKSDIDNSARKAQCTIISPRTCPACIIDTCCDRVQNEHIRNLRHVLIIQILTCRGQQGVLVIQCKRNIGGMAQYAISVI